MAGSEIDDDRSPTEDFAAYLKTPWPERTGDDKVDEFLFDLLEVDGYYAGYVTAAVASSATGARGPRHLHEMQERLRDLRADQSREASVVEPASRHLALARAVGGLDGSTAPTARRPVRRAGLVREDPLPSPDAPPVVFKTAAGELECAERCGQGSDDG